MFATEKWKLPTLPTLGDIFKFPELPSLGDIFKFPELPSLGDIFKFPELKLPELRDIVGLPVITLEAMGVKMPGVVTLEEQWEEKFEEKAAEVGIRLEPSVQIRQNGEVVATRAPYPTYPQRLPTMVIPPTPREIKPKWTEETRAAIWEQIRAGTYVSPVDRVARIRERRGIS